MTVISQLQDLYNVSTTPKYELGQRYMDNHGNEFQYVYIDDDVDVTAGMILVAADDSVSDRAATPDIAGASSVVHAGANKNCFIYAGVAMCAADVSEDERYMWVQTRGRNVVAMLTDGNVVAGSRLIANGDGIAGLVTNETDGDPLSDAYSAFGFALDADTGTSLAIGDCILDCPGV